MESVQQHRRVTGELRAVRRSRVATREAGLVIALPVREGMRVRAGDVLAALDPGVLELDLKRAEADAEAAAGITDERNATLAWREKELDLYRKSALRGAANVKEILDAESNFAIASARARQAARLVDVAQARVALLEKRLADMTVRAPFDGVVLARGTELGEWVDNGDSLVELVSAGEIEAWLDIPQRYYTVVAEQQVQITLALDASAHTVTAERIRIIPQVDPRSRSFIVIVTLDDSDGRLTPGMSLTAWVPTEGRTDQLTISNDAILRNDVGAFVYVARSGDSGVSAVPVNVQVRFPIDDRVVVDAPGLKPGDLVVVEGNERLFPGAPILPQPRDGLDPAARGTR
jgi:RND family efflux transporter MFP subunit